jgi:hypothetical protein
LIKAEPSSTISELFVHEEQKRIILSSSLIFIGWQLNTLQKLDPKIARAFLNLVTVADLIEKAHQISFDKLGKALNELKNIDAAKARAVFDALDVARLVTQAQQVSFADLGYALNSLKNVDAAKARVVFDALDMSELVTQAHQVSFEKLGNALSELSYVNIEKTRDILNHLDLELLASQACEGKYPTFLYSIPALARIDNAFTQQFLLKLPDEFLFQFPVLKNIISFNQLLFAFHFAELPQHAERLISFAQKHLDHFLKSKSLRNITSFLNLCSSYLDVQSIIRQYRLKFFEKIRFGEPSEIPYFLRVVYDHEPEVALEFLDYVEQTIQAKDVLGHCFYQIASSCFEHEDFRQTALYTRQAIVLFEQMEDNVSLGYTYFLLAKDTLALQNTIEAGKLAKQALAYAQLADRQDLQQEIEAFIAHELS